MAYKRANSELGTAPKTCLRSSFALRPHTSHWATSTEGLANPEPTSIYHPGHALLLAGSTGGQHKAKRNKTAPPSHSKPQNPPSGKAPGLSGAATTSSLDRHAATGQQPTKRKTEPGSSEGSKGMVSQQAVTSSSHGKDGSALSWPRMSALFSSQHVQLGLNDQSGRKSDLDPEYFLFPPPQEVFGII